MADVRRARSAPFAALLAAAVALASCAPAGPRPIRYGAADCDFCRMGISDPRFGAEVVTRTGAVREFDSIECLAAYLLQSDDASTARSVWVADFRRPGTLVPASAARYLRTTQGPASPMGLGIMAVASTGDDRALRTAFGGDAMRWPQVLALVEREQARLGLGHTTMDAMRSTPDAAPR